MSHRASHAVLAILCLACLAPAVRAEVDDPRLTPAEESAASLGIKVPEGTNLADFAEEAGEPTLRRGNETPGRVRAEIAELEDRKLMVDFLEPREAQVIGILIDAAKIRLRIAEKRQAREAAKKAKKPAQASAINLEIDALKKKLAKVQPRPSEVARALGHGDE